MSRANFQIYSASAGSGKTYTLTYNYLKLALAEPESFKSILAVTFTNKAKEEMKSRIIATLKQLSVGEHAMSADLLLSLSIEPKELKRRSRALIISILHNYSFFSVSTIDTFFQRVVRSFAREIGIHSGFRVELDQNMILSDVIDQMMLDMHEDPVLIRWLTEFAIYQINEGRSWDTKRRIQHLSNELFKEELQKNKLEIFRTLNANESLDKLKSMVQNAILDYENVLDELGKKAKEILDHHGINQDDFLYKSSGVGGFIEKVVDGETRPYIGKRVMEALEEGKWAKENIAVDQAVSDGLDFVLAEIVQHIENNRAQYISLKEFSSQLYTYGLLARISSRIEQYREENELLLISDFPQLLNEIISGSDSHYVYEKIGTRFKHYLMDEFQDTSGVQWGNFKPLVQDSLASGNFNMVVGDVKQSIYRWRGGDWNILLHQLPNDLGRSNIDVQRLVTNRRSKHKIVDFNNALFQKGSKLLSDQLGYKHTRIEEAYEDVEQNAFDEEKGLVKVEFINTRDVENWEQEALAQMIMSVEELQDHNYNLKDIAVLVRTNSEGAKVVKALMQHQASRPSSKYSYDVISGDSLFLKNNSAVRLILQTLEYALYPHEDLMQAQLYWALKHHFEEDEANVRGRRLKNRLLELRNPLLTDVLELAVRIFDLYSRAEDLHFVSAFEETVSEYLSFKAGYITEFLDWWAAHDGQTLQLSEDIDAIKVMTIHTSKGLQFKSVIIPFCKWKLDHNVGFNGHLLWCKTDGHTLLKDVPLVPIRYKKSLEESWFAQKFRQEKHDAYLDNLNILYVATTRAEEVLHLICPYQGTSVNDVAQVVRRFSVEHELMDEGELGYCLGDYPKFSPYSAELKNEFLLQERTFDAKLRRLNPKSSLEFFDESRQKSIELGEVVHWILSQIITAKDFRLAIDRAEIRFSISVLELDRVKKMLRSIWNIPEVSGWFHHAWEVKNETSILIGNGEIKRPDRVISSEDQVTVIDYKTGLPAASHHDQIIEYKSLLSQMGHKNVKGYILYLSVPKVVKI